MVATSDYLVLGEVLKLQTFAFSIFELADFCELVGISCERCCPVSRPAIVF